MARTKNKITRDSDGYVNLGCANGWGPKDFWKEAILLKCRKDKHSTVFYAHGPANRGMDNRVKCKICKFRYWYDSSD